MTRMKRSMPLLWAWSRRAHSRSQKPTWVATPSGARLQAFSKPHSRTGGDCPISRCSVPIDQTEDVHAAWVSLVRKGALVCKQEKWGHIPEWNLAPGVLKTAGFIGLGGRKI